MAAQIDPRLQRQLRRATADTPIEVIVLAQEPEPTAALLAAIICDTQQTTGLMATSIRSLPRAGVIFVTAPRAFVEALAAEARVAYLSATTIDFFGLR